MTLVTRTLGRRAVSIRGRAGRQRDSDPRSRWSATGFCDVALVLLKGKVDVVGALAAP